MARQTASMKKTRTRYSQAYKARPLALADRTDARVAARELGLQPRQLFQWRTKAQQQQSTSAREHTLGEENARLTLPLKHQLLAVDECNTCSSCTIWPKRSASMLGFLGSPMTFSTERR